MELSLLHNYGMRKQTPKDAKSAVLFIRHGLLENEDTRHPTNRLSETGVGISKRLSEFYIPLVEFLSQEFNPSDPIAQRIREGRLLENRTTVCLYGEKDERNLETATLLFPHSDKYVFQPTPSLDLTFYPPVNAPAFIEFLSQLETQFPLPEQRPQRTLARFRFLCEEYRKPNHGVWGDPCPSRGLSYQPIEECLSAFDHLVRNLGGDQPAFRVLVGSEPVPSFYYALFTQISNEMRIPVSGISGGEAVLIYLNSEKAIIDLERITPPALKALI